MPDFVTTLRGLLEKATQGPVYVGYDRAEECGPHKDSGLSLIDTGRQSDWPIARLCETHNANLLAYLRNHAEAILRVAEAARDMKNEWSFAHDKALGEALSALNKEDAP